MSGRRAGRDHTLDELLWWWPAVLRNPSLSDWERGFAASIAKKARSRMWRPSDKELKAMRSIVESMLEDCAVIDDAA